MSKGDRNPDKIKRVVTDTKPKGRKEFIMTNREFLTAFTEGKNTEEMQAYAVEQLKKLDERNAKRNEKPTKTQLENEETKKDILAALADKPMTAAEIGEACGISTNKASALAKQLTDDKKVTRTEVKIPKKGKCFQYALATEVEGETEE